MEENFVYLSSGDNVTLWNGRAKVIRAAQKDLPSTESKM